MAQKCRQRFIALQAWDVEQYSASAVVNFDVSKDRWSKPAHRCAANANTALKIRQSARQEPVAQWGTSDKDGSEDEQRQKYNECCLHAPLPFASILKGSHGMHPADGPAGHPSRASGSDDCPRSLGHDPGSSFHSLSAKTAKRKSEKRWQTRKRWRSIPRDCCGLPRLPPWGRFSSSGAIPGASSQIEAFGVISRTGAMKHVRMQA